jgi:hypothetical protein
VDCVITPFVAGNIAMSRTTVDLLLPGDAPMLQSACCIRCLLGHTWPRLTASPTQRIPSTCWQVADDCILTF